MVDRIMEQKSVNIAAKFVQEQVRKVCNGEFDLSYFVVTKSLKAHYKIPEQIVHKVLADRMAERDPGNAPKSNDRIPYAFIKVAHRVTLQGERVEHPDYIKEHNLKVDYSFYITNHIMKPVCQIFALDIDSKDNCCIPSYQYTSPHHGAFHVFTFVYLCCTSWVWSQYGSEPTYF